MKAKLNLIVITLMILLMATYCNVSAKSRKELGKITQVKRNEITCVDDKTGNAWIFNGDGFRRGDRVLITFKGKSITDCKKVTDKYLAKRWCAKHYPKCRVKFVREGDQRINIRKGKRIVYVEVVKSKSRGKRHGTTKLGYVIGYNINVHKEKSVTSYVIWNPYTDYCDDVVAVVDNARVR